LAACPPSVTLTIVGKGPLEPFLIREARRYNVTDRVRIVSDLSVLDLIHLFRTTRALLLPSSLEVYPRVVIEAAACGLPVVLPAAQIYQDFISAGFVATYVAGDAASFAETVVRTLDDTAHWEELSRAGRSFSVDKLGYDVYVRQLVDIYRGACE
jgi:glycosyltransferase involved in cell wall biosynthesis